MGPETVVTFSALGFMAWVVGTIVSIVIAAGGVYMASVRRIDKIESAVTAISDLSVEIKQLREELHTFNMTTSNVTTEIRVHVAALEGRVERLENAA
jgi:outer membrane murein-binding lipoprotein Lpp